MTKRGSMVAMFAALTCGLACGSAGAQSTVFALDVRAAPNQLVSFPLSTPAYNIIAPVTPDAFAMDFNEDGSILYCITYAAGVAACQLGTLDMTTGAFTPIAQVAGAGAAEINFSGLSFDASTDTMYCWGTNGAGSLYKIDLATANTSLVGALSGVTGALVIDIAIDNSGNMYAHDIGLDRLLKVDKNTAAGTAIGPTGFAANFAQGMDFDPATNVLYAAVYTGGGTGQFATFNLATGAATPVVNTQPWTAIGPEMEMAIKGVAVACYPDCNNDGALTVADFGCFQTKFVGGDPYADCNGDGSLTVADFGCFQTKFVAGCP